METAEILAGLTVLRAPVLESYDLSLKADDLEEDIDISRDDILDIMRILLDADNGLPVDFDFNSCIS